MKKIFLSILMLSLMYNCDNNSAPSAEDIATFNKNVEASEVPAVILAPKET